MRFFLDQHGCAKNQVDGELLVGILYSRGWAKTAEPETADLIIVNSCGFIEPAKKESLDAVLTARAAYPKAKIVLAGCLAERYADDLAEGLVEADAFFGNGDLSRLPEILDYLFPSNSPASRPVLVPEQQGVCSGVRPELLSFPRSAYVKITEGCDNHCSFCAIPLIRGALRSRTIHEIVEECASLVSNGVYELNLIGQDLAAYGCGSADLVDSVDEADEADKSSARANPDFAGLSPLARLLQKISTLQGDFRVRLLYIHPDHFSPDILPIMTADTRFLPYFDIPFQSGDADIIQAMNRKGKPEDYLQMISDIRTAFADANSPYGTVALRTTFLVGFPGETDEAFERTARFLAELRSTWSGAFVWSREEDTRAYDMKKRVPKKTAQMRLDTLKEIQIRITPEELHFFVGRTVEVLVEELIPDPEADTRLALGRAWFQAPEVDGSVVLQFEDSQCGIDGNPIVPGSVVSAVVMAVNGVDVEAVVR